MITETKKMPVIKTLPQGLEKIKIDSFKLRVSSANVDFINSRFATEYHKIYKETGEIDESHTNLDKHKVDITNGITTRIGVVHSMNADGGGEYVVFQINSKMLKEKYFEGINRRNIKKIYEFLMSFKIVYVTYEAFLDGLISDIDLCLDYNITRQAMQETNQKIYENILPHCYKFVSKPFKKKDNTGLQFNDRSKATPSRPYCKIYHKTTELESKSLKFAEAYLKHIDYSDIGRFEYTIKNSKHKEYIKLRFQTLNDFLTIQHKRHDLYFYNGIKFYTMKNEIIREFKDLSPTDRLLLEMINRLIQRGSDKINLYTALNIFDIPQEKSRMKKKLTNLLENIDDKNRLIANKESMEMLRVLRLDI